MVLKKKSYVQGFFPGILPKIKGKVIWKPVGFFSNKLHQLPPIAYLPSYRKQLASHKMGKNLLGFEKKKSVLSI